jgi:hypothetical protein
VSTFIALMIDVFAEQWRRCLSPYSSWRRIPTHGNRSENRSDLRTLCLEIFRVPRSSVVCISKVYDADTRGCQRPSLTRRVQQDRTELWPYCTVKGASMTGGRRHSAADGVRGCATWSNGYLICILVSSAFRLSQRSVVPESKVFICCSCQSSR